MKNKRVVTLSGVIRKRLPLIEAQMFEGIRQIKIVEELVSEGYEVSLKDFRQLLYRARKAQKKLPEPLIDTSKKENDDAIKTTQNEAKKDDVKPKKKLSLQELNNLFQTNIDLN